VFPKQDFFIIVGEKNLALSLLESTSAEFDDFCSFVIIFLVQMGINQADGSFTTQKFEIRDSLFSR